jgi:soluble cytochrome b562
VSIILKERSNAMAVSGISSNLASYQTNQNSPLAKLKEEFDKIGKALKSGNVTDAKDALTQIQKGLSAKTGSGINPVSSDIASLGKTLDSGDIKAAQQAFSRIQEKLFQGRPPMRSGNENAYQTPGAGVASSGPSAYDKTVRAQAQVAAQNVSELISTSNPARNPLLGAFVNTMV